MSRFVIERAQPLRAPIRIAYERRGSGPLVVLIQGLGLPGRMWMGLPEGLLGMGYSVVTPDNRGTGGSDKPGPPYRMAALGDDIAAVIADVTGGRGAALVVGISLGGMIAQHVALRHPELVCGLILASTTCGLPRGKLPRFEVLWQLVRSGFDSSAAARAMIQRRLAHPDTLRAQPSLFARWSKELASAPTPPRAFIGQMTAALGHNTGFRLRRIACPTEVLTGDTDEIVPAANSQLLARLIPDAELTVVPRTGHVFPMEEPLALPRAVQRLDARVREGGGRWAVL
ncbi:MAG: alpha/beta fold hydrolase [Myxococcales bacterium]|nr:alpha/beta fold hydrolase [Myxococcales bacterium]